MSSGAGTMYDEVVFVIVHPSIGLLSTLDILLSSELLLVEVSTGSVIMKSSYEKCILFVIFRVG